MKPYLVKTALLGLCLMGAVVGAKAETTPRLRQVYEVAHAGRVDEALAMMQGVLKDYPQSAKAHFVEADLLAHAHDEAQARTELARADRLDPGLPFANPAAVARLRDRLNVGQHGPAATAAAHGAPIAGFPWSLVLLGIGTIALMVLLIRAMNARGRPGYDNRPAYPGMAGGMPMPMASGPTPGSGGGSGIGSGLASGLATGLAVGAGAVAGGALARHFLGGGRPVDETAPAPGGWQPSRDDLGGSDFGVSGGDSWDDGSGGGGGDDWN